MRLDTFTLDICARSCTVACSTVEGHGALDLERWMDRETEVAHLAQANTHIERGEKAISRQLSAIDRLERSNLDTTEAVAHLQRLEGVLVVMKDHRDLIVRTIQSIDVGFI